MKVLLIAMCDSSHTAGWIKQFVSTNVEFQLFPSTPHRRIHRSIREMMSCGPHPAVSIRRRDRLMAVPFGVFDLVLRNRLRSRQLRKILLTGQFDLIHVLETQHGGYLYTQAVDGIEPPTPAALSIWGSDLVWFARQKNHRRRLGETLKRFDLLFVECSRDITIARELGFTGDTSPLTPASGGIDHPRTHFSNGGTVSAPSSRRVIMVKGYTGFVGRARNALRALLKVRHLLTDFEIHFYSVNVLMMIRLWHVRRRYGLRIIAHRKKTLTQSEVLDLFLAARLSLSLSASDGLPGSMREAAWAGAFPIESCGSCAEEWTDVGKGVMVVDPDVESQIVQAVTMALVDDHLVDGAVEVNAAFVSRMDAGSVRRTSFLQYEKLSGSAIRTL